MEILDSTILSDILDDMAWSFSRLNSFYNCKKLWYINYILNKREKENFFSQYGKFAHEIFDLYNKNKLQLYELSEYFNKNFNSYITEEAPANKYVDLRESYYNCGINYFSSFEGYEDKTIASEVKLEGNIYILGKSRKFIGFADRVSEDSNGIIITDYKSKKKFKNKNELKEYTRQLYLYSVLIKDKYGVYPYLLKFAQFRANETVEVRFNQDDLAETMIWIENTIKDIYNEKIFPESKNEFFCRYLCSVGEGNCHDNMFD